jgi:hypothetical protein
VQSVSVGQENVWVVAGAVSLSPIAVLPAASVSSTSVVISAVRMSPDAVNVTAGRGEQSSFELSSHNDEVHVASAIAGPASHTVDVPGGQAAVMRKETEENGATLSREKATNVP